MKIISKTITIGIIGIQGLNIKIIDAGIASASSACLWNTKLVFKAFIPAVCSSIIVSPIGYTIDKAVVNSSLNKVPFHTEIKNSLKTIKSTESILTFLSLVSILFISNLFDKKIIKILFSSIFLTPLGVLKDIKMSNKSKLTLNEVNKKAYIDFFIRDLISLFSALIFPVNINLVEYFFYVLLLQIPQTYFHQIGMINCNKHKNDLFVNTYNIPNKQFINNIFLRSIRNLIHYGLGIKLNLFILKRI
jgi:hypothetical protein